MGFVANICRLFQDKPCEACEVYRNTIQILKDDKQFLHSQIESLEAMLLKATRLAPVSQGLQSPRPDPIPAQPTSWRGIKTKLEDKYRKKPEDQVVESWAKKISDLEQQAGISIQDPK